MQQNPLSGGESGGSFVKHVESQQHRMIWSVSDCKQEPQTSGPTLEHRLFGLGGGGGSPATGGGGGDEMGLGGDGGLGGLGGGLGGGGGGLGGLGDGGGLGGLGGGGGLGGRRQQPQPSLYTGAPHPCASKRPPWLRQSSLVRHVPPARRHCVAGHVFVSTLHGMQHPHPKPEHAVNRAVDVSTSSSSSAAADELPAVRRSSSGPSTRSVPFPFGSSITLYVV